MNLLLEKMTFWLKILVSVALMTGIVWKFGGLREIGRLMAGFAPMFVFLVLVLYQLDRALMTYKWTFLLRRRGMNLSLFRGMKIYCASMIWGMFLPSTVGADAIRALGTSRAGLDSQEVVASIVVERMIGFLSSLLLGLVSIVLLSRFGRFDEQFRIAWLGGGAVLFTATAAFVVSFSRRAFEILHDRILRRFRQNRIMERMRQFHFTYLSYREDKGTLSAFFGMTFAEQFMPILHAWLIARGLGIETGFLFFAGAVPLSLLVSRLPVSVNGIGVFEGIFVLLMSASGMSAAEAVAICLAGRILQTASWLPWWMALCSGVMVLVILYHLMHPGKELLKP